MRTVRTIPILLAASAALIASAARAEDIGGPHTLAEGLVVDPILAARLRYEGVDQEGLPAKSDAVTLRLRAGAEFKIGGFALLAEGEGAVALSDRYNDTLPGNGAEPYPVVADPENLELNRLQLSYHKAGTGLTVGRQRIALDNQRFVGNVGWRQSEQTFDAVRAQAKVGPVAIDATYAISQRTVFGADSPNAHFDGDLVLLNGGIDLTPIKAKAFAYLVDYDARAAFSSQTYGVLANASIGAPLGGKLTAAASFAVQGDYGANPVSYSADYLSVEIGAAVAGFNLTAGYEQLGSDGGTAAFQTPLATLHAFNGWADLFLTTPANGLRDTYVGVGKAFAVPFLPGLRADLTWHAFDSEFGGLDYGTEWDVSLGGKLGPVALLAKYANYDATGFGADTRKLWLQAEAVF